MGRRFTGVGFTSHTYDTRGGSRPDKAASSDAQIDISWPVMRFNHLYKTVQVDFPAPC